LSWSGTPFVYNSGVVEIPRPLRGAVWARAGGADPLRRQHPGWRSAQSGRTREPPLGISARSRRVDIPRRPARLRAGRCRLIAQDYLREGHPDLVPTFAVASTDGRCLATTPTCPCARPYKTRRKMTVVGRTGMASSTDVAPDERLKILVKPDAARQLELCLRGGARPGAELREIQRGLLREGTITKNPPKLPNAEASSEQFKGFPLIGAERRRSRLGIPPSAAQRGVLVSAGPPQRFPCRREARPRLDANLAPRTPPSTYALARPGTLGPSAPG